MLCWEKQQWMGGAILGFNSVATRTSVIGGEEIQAHISLKQYLSNPTQYLWPTE